MRAAVVLVIAATGGLLLMFLLTDEGSPRTVSRSGTPAVVRPPREDPLELAGSKGRNLFTPYERQVVLDGQNLSYERVLLWCGAFQADSEEEIQVSDLRLILNPEPKTAADLKHHVRVEPHVPRGDVGHLLERAMAQGHSGVQASRGVLVGGRDLRDARAIRLSDGVQLFVADPDDPTRTLNVVVPTLDLELVEGRVIRATTQEKARVVGYIGVLEGEGITYEVESGNLRMEKAIKGQVDDLSIIGRMGVPVSFWADGPLLYTQPPTPDPGIRGDLDITGPLEITQGESRVAAKALTARLGRGRPGLDSARLSGDVLVSLPQGKVAGDTLIYDRHNGEGARLLLVGTPGRVELPPRGSGLPLLGGGGEAIVITTDGQIEVNGLDLPDDQPRSITLGPVIVVAAGDARVECQSVRVRLENLLSQSADAPEKRRLTLTQLHLEGAVRGVGPDGTFAAHSAIYTREHREDGWPIADDLVLDRGAQVRVLRALLPADGSSGNTQSGLFVGSGPLEIRGEESLRFRSEVTGDEAVTLSGSGSVSVIRFGEDEEEVARLDAETATLSYRHQYAIEWDRDHPRFPKKRMVTGGFAQGKVRFSIRDRIEGDGEQLLYDPSSGTLTLTEIGDSLAIVRIPEVDRPTQTVKAPSIVWVEAGDRVEASGRCDAVLSLDPLVYGGPSTRERVPTQVQADRLVAWLGQDGADRRLRISEILAEGQVVARQDSGAGISCEIFRRDVIRQINIIRGRPAHLDVVRRTSEGEFIEWIKGPAIVTLAGQALAQGPLEARFYGDDRWMPSLGSRTSGSGPAAGVPKPLDVQGQQDLFISRERLQLRGSGRITQGSPGTDGAELNGERVLVFLVPDVPAEGASATPNTGRGLTVQRVVVESNARFVSRDLQGDGDVLEFDRTARVLSLYRYQGSAHLRWKGRVETPRSRFDLDLKDPDNPRVYSTLPLPPRPNR